MTTKPDFVMVADEKKKNKKDRPRTRPKPVLDEVRGKKTKAKRRFLSEEITEFAELLTLTPEEKKMRASLEGKISRFVGRTWPGATTKQFGSQKSDLEWFESDMDLRVNLSMPAVQACKAFRAELSKRPKAVTFVAMRARAKVPLVCFVDRESQVRVDVSFDKGMDETPADDDGVDLTFFHTSEPHFREIVLVLKAFFKNNDKLDQPYHGGLGSFRLTALVGNFYDRRKSISLLGAGVDLVDFFKYVAASFSNSLKLRVYSRERKKPLRLDYFNVRASDLKKKCYRAAEILNHRPTPQILSNIFAYGVYSKILERREEAAARARKYCEALDNSPGNPYDIEESRHVDKSIEIATTPTEVGREEDYEVYEDSDDVPGGWIPLVPKRKKERHRKRPGPEFISGETSKQKQ